MSAAEGPGAVPDAGRAGRGSLLDWPDLLPSGLPGALAVPPMSDAGGARTVRVRPPGSKSLTNRLLLLAALARGQTVLRGALTDADDARVMIAALERLGAGVRVQPDGTTVEVRGVGGAWRIGPGEPARLELGNAGTATRFLAAAALLAPPGSAGVLIDGNRRMRERPIGELVEALRALGARVGFESRQGYPPVLIAPPPSPLAAGAADGAPGAGREVAFGPVSSSQFISALMLVGPCLPGGLRVRLHGVPTSEPYVAMTIGVLRAIGCSVEGQAGPGVITIRAGVPAGFAADVEPDASGAGPLVAAGALVPGLRVEVPGLGESDRSLQGDAGFLSVVRRHGPGTGWNLDMAGTPDMAMTAAVLAAFERDPATGAGIVSELRGLRTLRVKETDRIAAVAAELRKIGVLVESFSHPGRDGAADEGVRITPPAAAVDLQRDPVAFETYDDHRMAMSLSLVGLRRQGVTILDPGCVRKTYAGYWRDLRRLYACGPNSEG